MTKKTALLVVALILAAGATAVLWKVRHAKATTAVKLAPQSLTGLTADEVVLMLENQSLVEPSKVYTIVQSAQTRKIFLSGLRDYLALAARARREGLAADANIKLSLEYKRNYLLANLYQNKLDNEHKQYYELPLAQIESVWSNPASEKQFQAELRALRAVQESVAENSGNPQAAPELQGEALEKTRKQWARTKLLSDMAKGDAGFINQRAIELRLQVAEAGVLAFNYVSKHWVDNVIPTSEEIGAYLANHPEYDIKRKREKAEMVLRRAKAGEDFAKLALEFSEDRNSKDKGGLYEDVDRGYLWPEVERASLRLGKGQIAQNLVETQQGYHVVQLVDHKTTKDESGNSIDKFSVRHIFLRKTFAEPGTPLNSNAPPAFMEPREIATIIVRNEKRRRFIDEIVRTEAISLPEDFSFVVSEELKAAAITPTQQAQELIDKDKANGNKSK